VGSGKIDFSLIVKNGIIFKKKTVPRYVKKRSKINYTILIVLPQTILESLLDLQPV